MDDLNRLTYLKIENWDENPWDFLARDFKTSRGPVDIFMYDSDGVINVESFDYHDGLGDSFRKLTSYLSGEWEVWAVEAEPPQTHKQIEGLEGDFYWSKEDQSFLTDENFRILSNNLFGGNPRDYDDRRIDDSEVI